MSSGILRTVSPVDGAVVVERALHGVADIDRVLVAAGKAQLVWAGRSLEERKAAVGRFLDCLVGWRDELAREITLQMGRPIGQTPGEVRGLEERGRTMVELASSALAPHVPSPKEGFSRKIVREPLGVVAIIAPWNYPYLTSINTLVPALLAGNAVVVKHSHQTPLCAERYSRAALESGLPDGLVQHLHLDHAGGAVTRALAGRFIGTTLELGGKDPAYVREDADLAHAVENLVDGAFFNSGQSCCGVERIYVHRSRFDAFVEGFVELTRKYRLGNPLEEGVNLGPMVRGRSADLVREHIAEAVSRGAEALVDAGGFPADGGVSSAYLAPQVLVGVDHGMRVMREESFGPVE
ncbi:MAG: aldehyde dehydrogenase family protein, partial [Limisphaerales bacterium]